MSNKTRKNVEKFFTDFWGNKKNFNFPQALIHGDLSSDHIFWDEKTQSISGIIDFNDLCIGDVSLDFTGIFADYGEDFVEQVLSFYDGVVDDNFKNRISFYEKKRLFL